MNDLLLVGVFDSEDDLIRAAAAAVRAGLPVVDAYAPYAVHGLDRAMALRPSRLPWICFALGLIGATLKVAFEYWTTAVSWPLNVGGKPWNSLPAFVPVTFEVMVLFAGVSTVVAFIWLAGLRPWKRPALSDLRVTDDRFALVIRASDARFDRQAAASLLAQFHPISIEERTAESAGDRTRKTA
jgi:hypothetical protein